MSAHTIQQGATGFVERNIELAFWFAQQQLEHPELAEEVPNGATLILIPQNDPDLAMHNAGLGMKAIANGENVYFRHVLRSRW